MAKLHKTVEAAKTVETTRILERPDGFYWQDVENGEEIGPFATLAEAIADMESAGNEDIEVGTSLYEAEAQIGISDWIDPETGLPAEEFTPHIEDH